MSHHGCEDPVCPLCRADTFTVRRYHLIIKLFDWPLAFALGCFVACIGELLGLARWTSILFAALGGLPLLFSIVSSYWCERCEHEHGLIDPVD